MENQLSPVRIDIPASIRHECRELARMVACQFSTSACSRKSQDVPFVFVNHHIASIIHVQTPNVLTKTRVWCDAIESTCPPIEYENSIAFVLIHGWVLQPTSDDQECLIR